MDALGTNGSTNLEAGLRRAYDLAEQAVSDGVTEETRVLLSADIRPNVGASSASDFDRIVERGAESDVGLTVLGLGLGLGQEVMNAMSDVRGGNAFSLFDVEDAEELLEHDWPWLASPIAFDVATVFLSERQGALLARLAPESGFQGMRVDGDGAEVQDELTIGYGGRALDARGQYFQQESVAKATALAILVEAMRHAAELYGSSPEEAVSIMRAAHDRIAADAEAIGESALDREVQLAASLLALMEEGAPQEDPYGW